MRESSGVASGINSLPSGGGSISPLGDRFQPDLVRGSGSYSVPINLPKGPNELAPRLSLTYSTGSGNGPFGFGWRLDLMRIERRTDKGVPSYTDSDTFVIGDGLILIRTDSTRFRPKGDNTFMHIEKTDNHWRIKTGEGLTLYFGQSESSREMNAGQVFSWHLDESIDQAGNRIQYRYWKDGNRLYLSEIEYSIFSVNIRYENRPDILRNGRSGFIKTTAFRAAAIELNCTRLDPTLMRSYQLKYREAGNGISLLTNVELTADLNEEIAQLPELTFEYAGIHFSKWNVHKIQSLIPPPSLNDPSTQLVDLTGNSLPDVLQTNGMRTYLWRNNGQGSLEGPERLDNIPSTINLNRENVAFADLNGDGRVELFAVNQPLSAAFQNTGKGRFKDDPVLFRDNPNVKLASSSTRLMDIDADGVIDLIDTGNEHFLLFKHIAERGWEDPIVINRDHNLESFPDISLGDKGVRLADMTGDGLQDFVYVKSGNVSYWPYQGNGRWGQRVHMANPPLFPEGYREERLFVTDLAGSGCADIIYFDHENTRIWLNRTGNGFSDPIEIPFALAGAPRIILSDFFGDGITGFAWSSSQVDHYSSGYRFLRFNEGVKPFLLTKVDNGMGGISEIEYSTSSKLEAADSITGKTWQKSLPVNVHVVTSILQRDTTTNRSSIQKMTYRNGVYDGLQREFRGFIDVEHELSGDDSVAGILQELTFFQGDPEYHDLKERELQKSLAGSLVNTKIYEIQADKRILLEESNQTYDTQLVFESPTEAIYFPFLSMIETREYSQHGSATRIERTKFENYDIYGNVGRRLRESFAEGENEENWIVSEERYTYTSNEDEWLIKLPVRSEYFDNEGLLFAAQIRYYDGNPFIGLAEGNATRGLVTRIQEMHYLESKLPAGYLDGRDLSELGFESQPAGGSIGWFANSKSFRRDAFGNVVEQKDATGTSIIIEYDNDGVYPIKSGNTAGKETLFSFNIRSGEPETTVFPDGRFVRNIFDPIGRLIAIFETDDDGIERLVKRFTIDINHLPTSITSFVPNEPGFSISDFSADILTLAKQNISISRAYYSGYGKQIAEVHTGPDASDGSVRIIAAQQVHLNVKGVVSAEHPAAFVNNFDYAPPDENVEGIKKNRFNYKGELIETIGPGSSHFLVIKDVFSIRYYEGARASDPETNLPNRIEWFDARNRLIRIEEFAEDELPVTTKYDLSPDGQIEVVRDADDQEVIRYFFGGPGQPVRINQRDIGNRTYYRNPLRQLTERENMNGSSLLYQYDNQGRMTHISRKSTDGSAPQVVREIVYDIDPEVDSTGRFLDGRVALVMEQTNKIRYSYNRAGKITEESVITGGIVLTIGRRYNLQGNLTEIIYPDGRSVSYRLDRTGAAREVIGIASGVEYDINGYVTAYRLANGVDVVFERDQIRQYVSRIAATRSEEILRQIDYEYNDIGNITGWRDEMPEKTEFHRFSYDGLYRLTGFEVRDNDLNGPVSRTGSYTYDHHGNLQTFNDLQQTLLNYSDPLRPSLLSSVTKGATASNVVYSATGNIEQYDRLRQIRYDSFDRVAAIATSNNQSIEYGYDHQDRKIFKKTRRNNVDVITRYASGLYERNSSSSIRHIYLGKFKIASESVNNNDALQTTAFFLNDIHGTSLTAMDISGQIISNQQYSPFGGIVNTNATLDQYLGRPREIETGLIQFGSRYYASEIGRFITPDWYILENPNKAMRIPQAYNVYSYAVNNPVMFRDPSGLFIFLVGAIVAIIYVAAIASAAAFAVGFVAGLVYGLATGQGWGSLLTALETGLTTLFGMWLGGITGFLVGGIPGMIFGGIVGGLNGMIGGMTGIYDWGSLEGWGAFLSDSTWGLVGTTLGLAVHIINLFWSGSNYREDLSRRQNRHVYEGGIYVKNGFAFTMGNVISNAGQNGAGVNLSFIANHEELHIWQSRIFGPIFQGTYIAWAVGGFFVATIYWFFNTDEDYGSLLETAAYYDNPFEYWAYKNDNNWPPSGINSDLAFS